MIKQLGSYSTFVNETLAHNILKEACQISDLDSSSHCQFFLKGSSSDKGHTSIHLTLSPLTFISFKVKVLGEQSNLMFINKTWHS